MFSSKSSLSTFVSVAILTLVSMNAYAWEISLVYDGNQPQPGDEVTIKVQTDTPLFAMGLGVSVVGDANFTDAMKTADCNQYGWDPTWNSDPFLDANDPNWVYIGGVEWPGDANGTVGYVKMRYYSGEVAVFITEDDSFDANCQSIPYCAKKLIFGPTKPITLVYDGNTPDPNQEVTVYIHTTKPLFDLLGFVRVSGNAQITSAMGVADSNQYGWDTCWSDDPYLDPNGFLAEVSAAKWNADANGTVGYVKFIYYDGEVSVSLTGQAFDGDCNQVAFSEKNLVFGKYYEGEQQMQFSMMSGGIADANTSGTDANATTQNGSGTNSSNNGSDSSSGSNTRGGTSNNSTSGSGTNTGTSSNNGGANTDRNSNSSSSSNTGSTSSNNNPYNSHVDPNLTPAQISALQTHFNQLKQTMNSRKHTTTKTAPDFTTATLMSLKSGSQRFSPLLDYTEQTVITGYEKWVSDVNLVDSTVIVDGLLEIEPTENPILITRYGQGQIYVRNGAIRVLGKPGIPVVFTSAPDCAGPFIVISSDSSSESQLQFCEFDEYYNFADATVYIDNKGLDNPIANNLFLDCYIGIEQHGPDLTDISNNVFSYNICGVDANFGGLDGNQPTIDCSFYANFNTFDNCSEGLALSASSNWQSQEPNNIASVYIKGNLLTRCNYGIGFYNGTFNYFVESNAYAGNTINWDVDDPNVFYLWQTDPNISSVIPYSASADGWDWYIDKSHPFAVMGSGTVEDPEIACTSIFSDNSTRSGHSGVGAGVSLFNVANAGQTLVQSDFDNNLIVNFSDLKQFAKYWLFNYRTNNLVAMWDFDQDAKISFSDLAIFTDLWLEPLTFQDFASFANAWKQTLDPNYSDNRFDLNFDGKVDIKDFALFAKDWQKIGDSYPPIRATLSGDPNNISGQLTIGLSGYNNHTLGAYVLIDGQYIDAISDFSNNAGLQIDTAKLSNGIHKIKIFAIDSNNIITLSPVVDVNINNNISSICASEYFSAQKVYNFASSYNGALTLRIVAPDGNQIFDQNFIGSISIPANTLTGWGRYRLSINRNTGMYAESSDETGDWEQYFSQKFYYSQCLFARVLITLPNKNVATSRNIVITALENQCKTKNYKIVYLVGKYCRYENFCGIMYLDWQYLHTWYHTGDGRPFTRYNTPHRYNLDMGKGEKWYTYLKSDFAGGAFPGYYNGDLDPDDEKSGYSIHHILGDYITFLQMIYIDVCLSAADDELARQCGLYAPGNVGQNLFVGWSTGTTQNNLAIQSGSIGQQLWNELGAGNSIWDTWMHLLRDKGLFAQKIAWWTQKADNTVTWTGRP